MDEHEPTETILIMTIHFPHSTRPYAISVNLLQVETHLQNSTMLIKLRTIISFSKCVFAITFRGVARLNGAWGQKQVWRPYVPTWGLSEASVLHWRKYLWHCWDFSRTPQSFGPPIVIPSPGNCSPLPPSLRPRLRFLINPTAVDFCSAVWHWQLLSKQVWSLFIDWHCCGCTVKHIFKLITSSSCSSSCSAICRICTSCISMKD